MKQRAAHEPQVTGPVRLHRARATLGVALAVAAVALLAGAPLLEWWLDLESPESGPLGFLWLFAWFGFPVVGGLLTVRRPETPLGWLLTGISFFLGLTIAADVLAAYHTAVRPIPLGGLAVWIVFLSGAPAFIGIPFLILLFPTGRVASRRWRVAARVAAALAAIVVGVLAVRPHSTVEGVPLVNPVGWDAAGPAIDALIPILGIALGAFGVAVIVHAVVRFRRSTGVERQQFRWFAFAAAFFPVGMGVTVALQSTLPLRTIDAIVALTYFISFNGMAAAIGIAVTRHRLYDIDRVISRTLAYAALTATLIGVYAAGVLGVGALLPGEPSDLLVAGSTLAVAALFRPFRSRIQLAVDRRFNRSRLHGTQLLDDFSRRLRDKVDLDDVRTELVETTTRALEPTTTSLVLVSPAGAR